MGYTHPYLEPIPYGYVVYKDGTNIIGKDNATGKTISNNTDLGVVANAIIADLTSGGLIQIMPGIYSLKTPIITGTKSVRIEGGFFGGSQNPITTPVTEIYVETALGANYAITFGDATTPTTGQGCSNIIFDGHGITTHLGAIYCLNVDFAVFYNLYLQRFQKVGGYALNLEGTGASETSMQSFLNHIRTYQCSCGVRLGHIANGATILGGRFIGRLSTETVGMLIEDTCDTVTLLGPDFETHSHANGIALHITSGGFHSSFGARFEGNMKDIVIDAGGGWGNNAFFGGDIHSVVGGHVAVTDNGDVKSRFVNVNGYITENRGTSTGTGAQQTIAHGLGVTPNVVFITPTATGATEACQSAAADATNIYLTVTNLKTYQWYAGYL